MAKRTWLPELLRLVRAVCTYIGYNEERIKKFLPPEHHNKVDAVLLACQTLVAALDVVIIEGS